MRSSDFPSTGRFRLLCLTAKDLLTPSSPSAATLTALSPIIARYPAGIIELVALHPLPPNTFVWTDIPEVVKRYAEMRFYNGTELQDAYQTYGVDKEKGAMALVRPDGYIGTIAALGDVERIDRYLQGCLRQVHEKTNST